MTLIDVAIVLTVVGILAVPAVQSYNSWQRERVRQVTQDHIAIVNAAIADFYFENNRYPCPSLLKPDSGIVASPTATTNSESTESCNHADVDPSPGSDTEFLYGGVPYADLKISALEASDGWKHRLRYTVSEEQARNANPKMRKEGVLTVSGYRPMKDTATNEIVCDYTWVDRTTRGNYVLSSAGENAIGAYTQEGVEVAACGQTKDIENENCNNDQIFVWDVCAQSSDQANAQNYDDIFYFQEFPPARMWTYDVANRNNITSEMNGGFIGINTKNPRAQIDVVGNIKTVQNPADLANKRGNTNSQELCNENGDNCFAATDIGGRNPAMNCEDSSQNRGMRGLAESRVSCGPTFPATAAGNCAEGEVVIGIDAEGHLVCAVPEE